MKGKEVDDNLFIIRGIINYAKYLGKELWLTNSMVLKKFLDSSWLEDCINSFVRYKTPVADTDPTLLTNLVKQGTVLGPVLN